MLRQLKDCELELAESLIEQQLEEKLKEALTILSNFEESQKSLELTAKAQIYLRDFDSAEKSIAKLQVDSKVLQAKLHRFKGNLPAACDILADTESHEGFLELGQILFELKSYDESLLNILKATKLDKDNSECFYWLGKIYITTNDEVRSKKCFEKCLSLNPQNEKAISILSGVYR